MLVWTKSVRVSVKIMLMVIMYCLRWWYSAGWQWVWQRAVVSRVVWCMDMFSVPALVRTWFSPYKQTFTGATKGSIGEHFRAFIDRLISRVIGFLVRTILIVTGLICAALAIISGLLLVALWAFVPLAFPVSITLIVLGVGR